MIESNNEYLPNNELRENFLQEWRNVVGDLDDFIFYKEDEIVSEK